MTEDDRAAGGCALIEGEDVLRHGSRRLNCRPSMPGEETRCGYGPHVGSPILHWTDDQGQDVWIFGPLFDRVVDAPCAAEVWQGVRHLAVHGWFKELKRGRSE